MLIDARNAVYRAVYAGAASAGPLPTKDDFCVIFFRFISDYIHRFQPEAIHLFWDAPKATIWRRGIFAGYKDGRDPTHGGKYPVNIDEVVERACTICKEIVAVANTRNFARERQEADDLIYAFCRIHRHQKLVIISNDGDFKQIPFLFNNVDLYSPLGKNPGIQAIPEIDPVEMKCFTGDVSDNVRGYSQIGPARAPALIFDNKKRQQFFEMRGAEIYVRNRALVDLTLCPFVLHNISYIQEVMAIDPVFDLQQIRMIIQKYRVRSLGGEISSSILPFKFIGAKPEQQPVGVEA